MWSKKVSEFDVNQLYNSEVYQIITRLNYSKFLYEILATLWKKKW